jgi:hypothetical protein
LSAVAAIGLVAAGLAACQSGCRGFAYSFAGDAKGEPTPAAAVQRWAREGAEGPPGGDWAPAPEDDGGRRTFTNGDWSVSVTTAPGGGWLVDAGQSCRD